MRHEVFLLRKGNLAFRKYILWIGSQSVEIQVGNYRIRVEDYVYYEAVKKLIKAHEDEFVQIIRDIVA